MGKLLRIVGILLVVLVLGLVAASFALNAYLNSASFRGWMEAKTGETLGTPVKVEDFHFSLFQGFVMKGVTVPAPAQFPGQPLFAAKSFEFRYSPAALLAGKVEITKVVLATPALSLHQAADGSSNATASKAETKPAASQEAPSTGLPLAVHIDKLSVTDGSAEVYKADGSATALVKDADLESSLSLVGTDAALDGSFSVKTITLPGLIVIDDLRSPFTLKDKHFTLSHIQGGCAGGSLDGDGALDLNQAATLPFTLNLKGKDLDLQKLAEGATGRSLPVSGKVQAQIATVVPLSDPMTLTGKGHTEITDVKLPSNPVFQLLGTALNLPELAGGSFQLASSDFALGGRAVTLSNLMLQGPLVKITGGGKITFDQNYDLTLVLVLDPKAVEKLPKESQGALTSNSDGTFQTPSFRVYGKPGAMQTDLLQQLLKKAAGEAVQKKLGGALKKLF
ncbi:MAG: AsmA family protein [Verrucomicrobium sp.]|nr:AsmA family protein [Verrucomicrobium sp.]